MIHSVAADRQSFNGIKFKPGLNVVLAARTKDSDRKDSRNGLGKSTLLDILHFCLGGRRSGVLANAVLDDWTFSVELDIADRTYLATRSLLQKNQVRVNGDVSGWPGSLPGTLDDNHLLSNKEWTNALGHLMYGIDPRWDETYSPAFRSLVSYFARRHARGGYLCSFEHYHRQPRWNVQVSTSYLLDLDWKIASQQQAMKDSQNELKAFQKAITSDAVDDIFRSEADLEAVRIRLADEVEEEAKVLSDFRVLETYKTLEDDADRLTGDMHELIDQNTIDRRLHEHYLSSIQEEEDTDPEQISRIYDEAGLLFPAVVSKRLADVQRFHKTIVHNRRAFLKSEMAGLVDAMRKREQDIREMDRKKSKIMHTLKTHGALDEFVRLQEGHQSNVAKLEDILRRLKMLRDAKDKLRSLQFESTALQQRLELDLMEREVQKKEAITTFNSYSKSLYNRPGTLSIGPDSSGYEFDVKIERSSSSGYEKMKIFCYDLTLARLWARKRTSPGFLVHDSAIFADVDERQVAHALRLADTESQKHGYQYICMMNSDSVPLNDMGRDFDFESHVVAEFTDATPDGGLLGIRF